PKVSLAVSSTRAAATTRERVSSAAARRRPLRYGRLMRPSPRRASPCCAVGPISPARRAAVNPFPLDLAWNLVRLLVQISGRPLCAEVLMATDTVPSMPSLPESPTEERPTTSVRPRLWPAVGLLVGYWGAAGVLRGTEWGQGLGFLGFLLQLALC